MTMVRQLFLLLSCVSMCSMAMDNDNQGKWYLQLKTKDIGYYSGANIRYFKEYKAQLRDEGNTVSFPMEATDPLPIYECGNKRFFVTSAQKGSVGNCYGNSLAILDPSINKMIVVRAMAESNGYTGQYYVGFNDSQFQTVGHKSKNRVYSGTILYIVIKEDNRNRYGSWYHSYTPNPELLGNFSFSDILMAMRGHLQKEDFYIKSPVLRQKTQEIYSDFASYINFDSQTLFFNEAYWTQEENKLKGITYRR